MLAKHSKFIFSFWKKKAFLSFPILTLVLLCHLTRSITMVVHRVVPVTTKSSSSIHHHRSRKHLLHKRFPSSHPPHPHRLAPPVFGSFFLSILCASKHYRVVVTVMLTTSHVQLATASAVRCVWHTNQKALNWANKSNILILPEKKNG